MKTLAQRARGARSITTIDDYIDAMSQWLPTGNGITQTAGGQPLERATPDFVGLAAQMMGRNSIVWSLMLARFSVFSGVRFQWQRLANGRPSEMFGTTDLRILEEPWAGGTTADLLSRMLIDADLAGNSYWVEHEGEAVRWRPDWVDIPLFARMVRDPADGVYRQMGWQRAGYAYYEDGDRGRSPVIKMPDEVVHFAPLPDPLATYRGMSWLTPVVREIEADNLMTGHRRRFFQNGATPNMIVKHAQGVTPAQAKDFKDRLGAEYEGAENAYKCLHPDTDVAMWDGRRVPARAVAPGDVVVAWSDGAAVPGTVSTAEWQPPSPIVTVTTQRGRVIRTNDRHPFLVGGRWVDAAQLRPGDLLTTGLGWGEQSAPSGLTQHEAWLLGALVGDGSMAASTPVISAWDEGVRARFGRDHELRSTGKGHDYRLLGVTKLARQHGILGARSWDKRIPEAVMTGSRSVRAAFLTGLVDTDGHVTDPARRRTMELGITSVSKDLLADAQHLLASLGINSSLWRVAEAGRYSSRAAYRLCAFGNAQAQRLQELLDLACVPKRERLEAYAQVPRLNRRDASRFDRVASVTIAEPEPTIGIEVDDHHTHVTGGVVTHNTMHIGGGADVTIVGRDFQQIDFKVVQGHGETRLAAAAGVPPIIAGFSEGLSSATYSNYGQARRRFADGTMSTLWGNAAGSLQRLATPPPGARLWWDGRDHPFLREDSKDAAEIAQTQATTMRTLIDAGFKADSVKRAIAAGDMSLLEHSGLYSVQLWAPGTNPAATSQNPDGITSGGTDGSSG